MVTDRQVRNTHLAQAAAKADMDPKTARKYIRPHMQRSEHASEHTWR